MSFLRGSKVTWPIVLTKINLCNFPTNSKEIRRPEKPGGGNQKCGKQGLGVGPPKGQSHELVRLTGKNKRPMRDGPHQKATMRVGKSKSHDSKTNTCAKLTSKKGTIWKPTARSTAIGGGHGMGTKWARGQRPVPTNCPRYGHKPATFLPRQKTNDSLLGQISGECLV